MAFAWPQVSMIFLLGGGSAFLNAGFQPRHQSYGYDSVSSCVGYLLCG